MNELNRERDKSLKSGERITKKQEFLGRPSTRYRMASEYIKPTDIVIDMGCGSGYGSELLHELCGCDVIGVDDSVETIEFASHNCDNIKQYVQFIVGDIGNKDFCLNKNRVDNIVIVACEILEHFPSPEIVMDNIKLHNPRLVIGTVPEKSAQHVDKWHYKEFELSDLDKLFKGIGYTIKHSEIVAFSRGNAIFFVAEKA